MNKKLMWMVSKKDAEPEPEAPALKTALQE